MAIHCQPIATVHDFHGYPCMDPLFRRKNNIDQDIDSIDRCRWICSFHRFGRTLQSVKSWINSFISYNVIWLSSKELVEICQLIDMLNLWLSAFPVQFGSSSGAGVNHNCPKAAITQIINSCYFENYGIRWASHEVTVIEHQLSMHYLSSIRKKLTIFWMHVICWRKWVIGDCRLVDD